MDLNPRKYHSLMIKKYISNGSIELGKESLHVEAEQKLLRIILDKDLNFCNHGKSIIKTANQKLIVFIRIAPRLTNFNKHLKLLLLLSLTLDIKH